VNPARQAEPNADEGCYSGKPKESVDEGRQCHSVTASQAPPEHAAAGLRTVANGGTLDLDEGGRSAERAG
jgi:hypothetical protein